MQHKPHPPTSPNISVTSPISANKRAPTTTSTSGGARPLSPPQQRTTLQQSSFSSLKAHPPPPMQPYQNFTSQNIFHAVNTLNSEHTLKTAQSTFEAAANMQSSVPQCWVDATNSTNDSSSKMLMPPSISSHCYATYSLPEGFLFEMRHRQKMMIAAAEENQKHQNQKQSSSSSSSDPLLLQVSTNWNQEFQLALDRCFSIPETHNNNNDSTNKSSSVKQQRKKAGQLLDDLLAEFDKECETTIVPAFVNLMFDPRALIMVSHNGNNENETDAQGRFLRDPLMMKMQKLQQEQQQKQKSSGEQYNDEQQQQPLSSGRAGSATNNIHSFASLGGFASVNLSQQLKEATNNCNNLSVMMTGQQMDVGSASNFNPSPVSGGSTAANNRDKNINNNNNKDEETNANSSSSSSAKNYAEASSFSENNFELHVSLISSSSVSPNAIQQIQREIECQRFFLSMLLETCFVRPLPVTIAPMFLGSYKGHHVLVSSSPRILKSNNNINNNNTILTEDTSPDFAAILSVICRACNFTPYWSRQEGKFYYGPTNASCSFGCDGRLYVNSMIGLLPFLPPPPASIQDQSSASSYLREGIMLDSKQTLEYIQFCAENDLIVDDELIQIPRGSEDDDESSEEESNNNNKDNNITSGGVWSCGIYENCNFSKNQRSLNGIRKSLQRFTVEKVLTANSSSSRYAPASPLLGLKLLHKAKKSSSSSSSSPKRTESGQDDDQHHHHSTIRNLTVEMLAQSLATYFHSCFVSKQIGERVVLTHGGSLSKLRIGLSNNKNSQQQQNQAPPTTVLSNASFSNLLGSANNNFAESHLAATEEFSNNAYLTGSLPRNTNNRSKNSGASRNDDDEEDDDDDQANNYADGTNNNKNDQNKDGKLRRSIDLVAVLAALFCTEEGQYNLWSSPDSQDLPKIVERLFPGAVKAFSILVSQQQQQNSNNNDNNNFPPTPFSLLQQSQQQGSSSSSKQKLLERFAELIGVSFAPGVSADTGSLEYHFVTNSGFEKVLPLCSTRKNIMARKVSSFEDLDDKIGGSDLLVGDYAFQWRYQKFVFEADVDRKKSIVGVALFESEVEEAQSTLLDSVMRISPTASAFEALHLCKYLQAKYSPAAGASSEEMKTKVSEACVNILSRVLASSSSSSSSSYLMILCRLEVSLSLEKLERYDDALVEITRATTEVSSNLIVSSSASASASDLAQTLALPILEIAQRIHEAMTLMDLAEQDARAIYSIRSKLHHQTTIFQCKPFLAQLLFNESSAAGNNNNNNNQNSMLRLSLTPHIGKGISAGSLGMILTANNRKQEAEKLLRQELTSWENVDNDQTMIDELLKDDNSGGIRAKKRVSMTDELDDEGEEPNVIMTNSAEDVAGNNNNNNQLNILPVPFTNHQSASNTARRQVSDLILQREQQHHGGGGSRRPSNSQDTTHAKGHNEDDYSEATASHGSSLETTLKLLHNTAFPASSAVLGSLPLVLNNIACLHVSLRKYDSAIRLYQREIKILEDFRKPKDENEEKEISQELHLVRVNLATALMHATQWSKSELLLALAQETMQSEFGDRSLQVGEVMLKRVMLHLTRIKALKAAIQKNREEQEIRRKQQKFLFVKDNKDILGNGDEENATTNNNNDTNDDDAEGIDNKNKNNKDSSSTNEQKNTHLFIDDEKQNDSDSNTNNTTQQQQSESGEKGAGANDTNADYALDISIREDTALRNQLLGKVQEILEDAFDIFKTISDKSNGKATIEISGLSVKQLLKRNCMMGISAAKEQDSSALLQYWQQKQK